MRATAGIVDDEKNLTEDEKNVAKAEIRKAEDVTLQDLIFAGSYKDSPEETRTFTVYREKDGQRFAVFSFRLHALSEDQYLNARRKNTKYKRNKATGTQVVDHVETARYRSQVIFDATVEADRDKIWNNHQAWEHYDVATGVDMIDKLLKAGEKDDVLELIDEISGYSVTAEDTAKN